MKNNSFRSGLKNARGMGAAHDGTHHFWVQRLTAIALIPLSLWFVINLMTVMLGDALSTALWMQQPVHALLMGLFIIALFWHARLGLQVIIEDYVHAEPRKFALLILCNGLNMLLCAACLLALVRIHFVGV